MTNKSNPLKYFNDEKAKRLKKAQNGMTAFQSYLKNVPGATASDTTLIPNKKYVQSVDAPSKAYTDKNLMKAYRETYGDSFDTEEIPSKNWNRDKNVDTKGADAYLRSMKKIGGQTKSKKK